MERKNSVSVCGNFNSLIKKSVSKKLFKELLYLHLGTNYRVYTGVEQTVLTPFRLGCNRTHRSRGKVGRSFPKFIWDVSTPMIYRPILERPSLDRIFVNYDLVCHLVVASLVSSLFQFNSCILIRISSH